MFKPVPPEGQRYNLIHCFNAEVREWDEGMKGMNERNKGC